MQIAGNNMMAIETATFDVERNQQPVPDDERVAALMKPGFGRVFTDHMVLIDWNETLGWTNPRIIPRGPLSLDPASSVLHYAQEIFEGLKAYRGPMNSVLLFRPEQNARRFAESAKRMAMPELPEGLFLEAIKALALIDSNWVPNPPDSLYLRPFMIASEAFLGVRPARNYVFCVIASPAGDYFSDKNKALNIWIEDQLSRAAPGGTGAAKCGGNYAAGLNAQSIAVSHGCDQVCYLDAVEHKWIEELGGMNIAFVMSDNTIITPPLGGTILPGITRDSLFTIAKNAGFSVVSQAYSFDQLMADAASGHLVECFACGTAAVIAPIGTMKHRSGTFEIGNGKAGTVTQFLRSKLVDIQCGIAPDEFGWVHSIGPDNTDDVDGL